MRYRGKIKAKNIKINQEVTGNMSMVIQSRTRNLSTNFKSILKYLDKQYPNYGFDEVQQDIETGLTNIEEEMYNAFKTLTILKDQNKNNQKQCTAINNFIKMMMKENKIC